VGRGRGDALGTRVAAKKNPDLRANETEIRSQLTPRV